MKQKKAQAAMEFLMTYGWAILVVLLAIGALAYFGVLSPQNLLPERTTFAAPLPNLDNAVVDASTNSFEIAFNNNQGVPITLPLTGSVTPAAGTTCANAALTATYNGAAVVANTTQIPNGGTFLVTWDCDDVAVNVGDAFETDATFQFTNTQTTQTRSHTGTVQGKYS
jgi:hypothetical protein